MNNIIIFNQRISTAGNYGIGSFIKMFEHLFNVKEFNIFLVELYSSREELDVDKMSNITNIYIPYSNEIGLISILSLYINNIEGSIIFLNYSSLFKIARVFKEKFFCIRIIGVIHSLLSVWSVNGNERLLYKYSRLDVKTKIKQLIYELSDNTQYFDKTIALSVDSINILNKVYGIDKDKLCLIPNGIKDNYKHNILKGEVRDELSVDPNEKIILYVGRLDRLKGIDTLVLAFNRLVKKYNNCRLIFAGDGDFSTISSLLGKAASKITFTGRITQKELKKWYSIADIGVFPSLTEECSFVGIEMLMHGLPIVATNARGVRNMFHNMENSLTVNCRSRKSVFERELYEAMLRLLTDKELADELRKKARRWYLDHYQFKFMKQRYLELVEELIQNNNNNG